jgi:hypothetical protein
MSENIKILLMSIAILIAVVVALAGCATQGTVRVEGESGSVTVDVHRGERYYRSTLPHIPPGHMPPPGMCRIWLPGVPPGQQPPPGDCRELEYQIPPGAWLIRGE